MWFTEYGYPCVLLSDGGPQFRQDFKDYCDSHGIQKELSSAYYPASNGLAEAAVKSTEYLMRKSENYQDFCKRHLEWKNVPTKGRSDTPAERFFGRVMKSALPRISPIVETPFVDSRFKPLRVNDRVRIQNPTSKAWDDFGTITEVRPSKRSYSIWSDNKNKLINRNRIFLRPLATPEDPDNPVNPVKSSSSQSKAGKSVLPPLDPPPPRAGKKQSGLLSKKAKRTLQPATPLRRSARLAAKV